MIVQNLILHLLRNLCKNYAVHRDQVLNMLPPPATPCHTDRTGLCQQRSDTSYYQDFAKGNVTLGHSQDGTHSTIWSTGNMYLENHPLLLLPLKEDQPKHQVWLLLKEEGDERIYKQEQACLATHRHLHAGRIHSTGQLTHHLWLGSSALQTEMRRGQDQLPLTQQNRKYLIEWKLTDSKGQH